VASLIAEAFFNDRRLVATVRLTDDHGGPLCATSPSVHVTWAPAA
jgi:hypothetical protein